MNKKILVAAVLVLAAAFLSWSGSGPGLTDRELGARFYYDLGPDAIDVSGYPWLEQQRYYLFQQTCSQCHTLSRAVNAPFVERRDWKRYVTRMHLRDVGRGREGFFQEEGRHIVEFLVFDARKRKLERRAGFEKATEELKAYFARVQAQRSRLEEADDRKKVESREQAPYTGVK